VKLIPMHNIQNRKIVSQIRYDTCIALPYRNDSRDSLGLRYTGTICTVHLMTRTVSYDTYRVSYDTNFYALEH
jgi:hypothetical protein